VGVDVHGVCAAEEAVRILGEDVSRFDWLSDLLEPSIQMNNLRCGRPVKGYPAISPFVLRRCTDTHVYILFTTLCVSVGEREREREREAGMMLGDLSGGLLISDIYRRRKATKRISWMDS
jgi:hypothetical protein